MPYNQTTGKLSSITAPDGNTLDYAYDGFLPLLESWTGEITGDVSRTYNNNFWVTSTTVNIADTISYGYDNDGLLTQAGNITIDRDAQNGLITGTVINSVTDSLTYNSFGETDSYSADYSITNLFDVQYTRDDLGRITQKTETVEGVTDTYDYYYDLAGRLTDVDKNGTNVSHYEYDSNGNRLSHTTQTDTTAGDYDDQDRLLTYGDKTYTHIENGELASITDTQTSETTFYYYDVLGNLMAVTLPDNTQIDYIVDGRNRRIGKKVNGTLVQGFLYKDQLNPIAELDGSGAVVSIFVYGTKSNVPDYMEKGGSTYRIISDHLGSPRIVIDTTSGAVVQRIDYDEFGNVTSDTNPGFQPFSFAGGIFDAQTKLIRFGFRDYDSTTGRWTARDPILFAGGDTNLYSYVNDPINWIDPWGLVNASPEFTGDRPNYIDYPNLGLTTEPTSSVLAKIIAKHISDALLNALSKVNLDIIVPTLDALNPKPTEAAEPKSDKTSCP